jgi:hypothetical protein
MHQKTWKDKGFERLNVPKLIGQRCFLHLDSGKMDFWGQNGQNGQKWRFFSTFLESKG